MLISPIVLSDQTAEQCFNKGRTQTMKSLVNNPTAESKKVRSNV